MKDLPQRGYADIIPGLKKLENSSHVQSVMSRSLWAVDVITQLPHLDPQKLNNVLGRATSKENVTAHRACFELHAIGTLIQQLKIPVMSLPTDHFTHDANGRRHKFAEIDGLTMKNELLFCNLSKGNSETRRAYYKRWRAKMRFRIRRVDTWRDLHVFLMIGHISDSPFVANFPAWEKGILVPLTVAVLHQPTGDAQLVYPKIGTPVFGPSLPDTSQCPWTGPKLTSAIWQRSLAQFPIKSRKPRHGDGASRCSH